MNLWNGAKLKTPRSGNGGSQVEQLMAHGMDYDEIGRISRWAHSEKTKCCDRIDELMNVIEEAVDYGTKEVPYYDVLTLTGFRYRDDDMPSYPTEPVLKWIRFDYCPFCGRRLNWKMEDEE